MREGLGHLHGVGYEILALFLPSHGLPRPLNLILSVPWVQAPWALSIKAKDEGRKEAILTTLYSTPGTCPTKVT